MKECFHFTKSKYLKSILENGLQPQFGTNCSIIGDRIGEKVSYSVGSDEATRMFKGVYEKYSRMSEGFVNMDSFDENSRKAIEELQSAKDFEDWEGPGVYLMFDGEYIDETHRDESKPYDSYTDMPIPPDQLKVCVIRDKETGEIISSKYDVTCFWLARSENKNFGFFNMKYKDKIEKFEAEKYEMEYVELERFCEMHPEILEEQKERRDSTDLLPKPIEEVEDKFGLIKIRQLIGKIKSKIKKVLKKDEIAKQNMDGTAIESDINVGERGEDDSFMNKLREESKTIEESAVEIVTNEEHVVETKIVNPQDKNEI